METSKGGGPSACVVFGSRYGNTEKIARSLEAGLRGAGIRTALVDTKTVAFGSLAQYDLICVGAPTETFGPFKPVKEFLEKLKGIGLAGKFGFAFDTRVDSHLSGSAAKSIENELKGLGLRPIAPRESAIVSVLKEKGVIAGAVLKDGEEKRFEEVGLRLGASLLAAAGTVKKPPNQAPGR
jgi:flavodoxin